MPKKYQAYLKGVECARRYKRMGGEKVVVRLKYA